MKNCSFKNCVRDVVARGLCKKHWQHLSRYGEARVASDEVNEIVIKKNHAEIILYSRHLLPKDRALIDKEDIKKIEGKRFYKSHGYAKISQAKPTIYLHQIIMKCKNPLVCDHINRNKLDNRKKNLRCVTRKENNLNK